MDEQRFRQMTARRATSTLLLVSFVLGACSSGGAGGGGGEAPAEQPGAAPAAARPIVAELEGFRAEATSASSVLLSWSPVPGAVRYEIDGAVGEREFLPAAALGSDQTSFEVMPVPEAAEMRFRVTAVGAAGGRTERAVALTTPVEQPNPYSVQVVLEETQGVLGAFDTSTFDPSTFDPSTVDPSLFDDENFDPSGLTPHPATVTREIGPQGGVLEATSATGVVYSLTFPVGSLPFVLEFSMTPVAAIEGLPPEVEFLGAVQVEPEGVPLAAPAVLAVAWPEPVESSSGTVLVGIGFGSGGGDFHFLPYQTDPAGAAAAAGGKTARPAPIGAGGATLFTQTQSQGVAKASPEAVRRNTRDHSPSDRSRSSRQRAAARDAAAGGGDELAPLVPPFEHWLAENIQDRARELSGNQGTHRGLFEVLEDFELLLEKWGDDLSETQKNRIWDPVLAALHARLKEAAEAACMSDEHMYGIQLAERLTNPASAFDREMLKRFTDKYGAEGRELIRKALELARRCPLYLRVESEITHIDLSGDIETRTKIEADVPLKWRLGGSARRPYLMGSGDIVYEAARYTLHNDEAPDCLGEPNVTLGSRLVVLRLYPQFKTDGTLEDFSLERYHATGRMNDIIITFAPEDSGCETGAAGNRGRGGDVWWANYGAYMLVNGGFPIEDWIVRANAGMSTIADKGIDHDGSTFDLGNLTGVTRFFLINENPQ